MIVMMVSQTNQVMKILNNKIKKLNKIVYCKVQT